MVPATHFRRKYLFQSHSSSVLMELYQNGPANLLAICRNSHHLRNNMLPYNKSITQNRPLVRTNQHHCFHRNLYCTPSSHAQQAKRKVGIHTFYERLRLGNWILLPAQLPVGSMDDDRLRWHYSHVGRDSQCRHPRTHGHSIRSHDLWNRWMDADRHLLLLHQ